MSAQRAAPFPAKLNEKQMPPRPLRLGSQSYWSIALRSLRQDRLTLAAIGIVLLLALLALLAPVLTNVLVGVGPNTTNPSHSFAQPYLWPYIKWQLGIDTQTAAIMLGQTDGIPHWLGADRLGRDQLARLLYGGRISLGIALAAAAIGMVFGVAVGGVAGYFGGVIDDIVMWFINTVVAIPTIYLLIIVCAILKPSPTTLILFLGFFGWFGTARFMRGNVLKVKQFDYTLSARAIGATNWRILTQHIIPNSIPVIVVITFIDVGVLILVESVLSFLGLGVQPPTPTWGNMLNRARDFFFMVDPATGKNIALHLMYPPGILIWLSVLCFYLIGDGLRDALDPMLKQRK